jgi:kumamolisin
MSEAEGWVTLTQSKREPLQGAREVGRADAAEIVDVTVRVRPRKGKAALARAAAAMAARPPRARRYLRREEYAATHGADPGDLAKVVRFASEHGLTAYGESIERRIVHLVGTAEAMNEAFKVDLKTYRVDDSLSYRSHADPVQIPAELAGIVEAVIGFDTRPHARPHFRIAEPPTATEAEAAAAPRSFDPPELATLYNYPAADGSGEVIGILELTAPHGSGYRPRELRQYFRRLGLGGGPGVNSVSVDGAHNRPGTNPNDRQNADGEVALDIEVAGSIAPGSKIVVYFAPNTAQGFFDLISHAVHDTINKPTVLSLSWGGPEDPNDPTTQQIHQVLQAATLLGVTVCVASGDNGSSDDPNRSSPAQVDFPASSPFALGCGGTRLTTSGGGSVDEVVWNEGARGMTGGGVSRIFDLPTFQAQAGVPPVKDPAGPVRRGVPDVSGNAATRTGYNILVDGHSLVVGGTSAVAPLWAALIARLNQKLGHPVGYLNPVLYRNPGVCNDITVGNNGDYQSGPGWDPCTGLGTPDGMQLLAVLSRPGPAARLAAFRARRRAIVRRSLAALIRQRVRAIMKIQGRQIVRRRLAVLMRPHRAAGHGPQKLARVRRQIRIRVRRRVRAHFRRLVKSHIRQSLRQL